MEANKHIQIIRFKELLSLLRLGKSTTYNRINEGLLPPPISLGSRAIGFIKSEIEQVLEAMIQGYQYDEIKALVAKIVADRNYRKGVSK